MLRNLFIGALVAIPFIAVAGCGKEPAAQAPADPAAAKMDMESSIEAALAELSPEDRALVLAQKICPVAGGPLGGMGVPIAMDIDGRKVFICCDGCRQQMLDNPSEHLAKLDAAMAAPADDK
jgi:hypothetical protein